MGGKMSRNKGQRGEREIINLLQPVVNEVYSAAGVEIPKLQRNTLQSDGGGFDIVGLTWMAPEVKFQETYNLNGWWRQTKEQCGKEQTPVLFYRKTRVAWRVRFEGMVYAGTGSSRHWQGMVLDVDINDFLEYFRTRLLAELI